MRYLILSIFCLTFLNTHLDGQNFAFQIDSVYAYSTLDNETNLRSRSRLFYELGTDGRIRFTNENLFWNRVTSRWSSGYRIVEILDKKRRRQSSKYYSYTGDVWLFYFAQKFHYGPSERLDSIIFSFSQENNFTTEGWERYYYDSQNRLIRSEIFSPLPASLGRQVTRSSYDLGSYDRIDSIFCSQNENKLCHVIQERNNTEGDPVYRTAISFTSSGAYTDTSEWKYDASGKVEEYLRIHGNGNLGQKIDYFYADDENTLTHTHTYSRIISFGEDWDISGKNTFAFDAASSTYSDSVFDRFSSTDTYRLSALRLQRYRPEIAKEDVFIPEVLNDWVKFPDQPYGRLEQNVSKFYSTSGRTSGDSIVYFYSPSMIPRVALDDKMYLTVFPNPSESSIDLRISGVNQALVGEVQVFDHIGRQVLKQEWNSQSPIDIQSLRPGVYVARVLIDGEGLSAKFVKR